MAFSAALTLTDLSDYLAPSQLCIKPVTMVEDTSPDEMVVAPRDSSLASTEIVIDPEHGHYEISAGTKVGMKLKKAEITLNDCLACSGCITSAESVLVSMQSHEEVYRVIAEQPELVPILSIAPQSLASLAALHDLTLEETMRGLRLFFKREFGFRLVFDTTFARSVSLAENRLEFLERRSHTLSALAASASSPPGPLPILSSACPGWICYAEKTHGELLPFVSAVKSSQAIMGTLVKSGDVAKSLGLRPDQIYHVAVMPCYDKKLEASRPDFTSPLSLLADTTASTSFEVRDVDCVLTTGEVQKMLDEKQVDLVALALSSPASSSVEYEGRTESGYFPSSLSAPGTSSGGYLFNTIKAAIDALPAEELYRSRIVEKKVRSEDYVEYSLVVVSDVASSSSITLDTPLAPISTTKTILRAAKCYGFRNLQNVVRKIGRDSNISVTKGAAGRLPVSSSSSSSNSTGSSSLASIAAARRSAALARRKKPGSEIISPVEVERPFDYIEVMACPSGCVNGGGQIAPPKEVRNTKNRRLLTERSENGRKMILDEEGMPDMSDRMAVDDDVVGAEKVLSGKEWVAKVEEVYWSSNTDDPSMLSSSAIDLGKVDPSILPYLLSGDSIEIQVLMNKTVEELIGTSLVGEERSARRNVLLRTQYRQVEDGEVNGLAVKW